MSNPVPMFVARSPSNPKSIERDFEPRETDSQSFQTSIPSHVNEIAVYPIIEDILRKRGITPSEGWTSDEHYASRSRQFFPKVFTMEHPRGEKAFREEVVRCLSERFFLMFSTCSTDPKKHGSKKDGVMRAEHIEVDYFDYVVSGSSPQEYSVALEDLKPEDLKPEDIVKEAQQQLSTARLSGTKEVRPVILFELTDSPDGIYKLCQLERDLAVYEVWRRFQGKAPADILVCGIVAHPSAVATILKMLKSPECDQVFPRVVKMVRQGRFECARNDRHNHIEPTPLPNTFWAQVINGTDNPTQLSKTVAFQVTPVIPNIDGLKKAVKAEMQLTMPAPLLKVYAHDAATGGWVEVTEPWAPLTANTGLTAYHVVVGS